MTMQLKRTNLESLLDILVIFKSEVLDFINSPYSSEVISYSDYKKWLNEHIKLINDNLAKFNIQVSFSSIYQPPLTHGINDNVHKLIYLQPTIQITCKELIINYHQGLFFDRLLVSTSLYDVIQLEPTIYLYKNLSHFKYKRIQDIIETAIAEICQHQYTGIING